MLTNQAEVDLAVVVVEVLYAVFGGVKSCSGGGFYGGGGSCIGGYLLCFWVKIK